MTSRVAQLNQIRLKKQYRSFNHDINLAMDKQYISKKRSPEQIRKEKIKGYLKLLSKG